MLKGKTIVLGVSGSIAAYKIAGLASRLVKLHADVHVIMTQNATNFITPITFESLTGNKCMVDTFDRNFQFHVAHVSLAKKASVLLVAPASANIIAKLAYGLADDMLSTTALAMTCPVLVSPAMNVNMYHNPVVQENLEKLVHSGKIVIPPENGYLVTAGPTREALDPVRFLSNHSTGKMGYAIARQAMLRGAEVTLVSGPVSLTPPPFVKVIPVVSAAEMFQAVSAHWEGQELLIKAAAVADYTPLDIAEEKLKKEDGEFAVPLKRTEDILLWLGEHKKPGQVLCGFSMETNNVVENSRKKLEKKHADLIAANSLKETGAGFGTDTNHLLLIGKEGVKDLPLLSKEEAANILLDELLRIG